MRNTSGRFDGSITTNGYLLTRGLATRLCKAGVTKYQITLDGSKESHDKTRVLKGGGPSFDVIWKNLTELKDSNLNFSIVLRLHVNSVNEMDYQEFVDHVQHTFSRDSRFSAHTKSIENLGGVNGVDVPSFVPSSAHEELNLDSFEAENETVCYASMPNSMIIRANGRIAKCTVALNDERNDVGRLQRDGKIEFFSDRLKLWFHGYESQDPRALLCPLWGLPKLDNEIRGD